MTTKGRIKLPSRYPTWLVKAIWRGTSLKLKIVARDEQEAWDKASNQVKRMQGGISCLELKVLGTI